MMLGTHGSGSAARAPRFPAHMGAQYASDRLELRAQIFDVSATGAFVATETPDEPGTEACLSLRTHLTQHPVEVRCRVARAGDLPRQGMGLAFLEPQPEARSAIERYCSLFTEQERVVMVDDEAAILRLMGRFFARESYSFIGIDEPIHTEETLLRLKPAVVILDIMMPSVSGITVARQLLANPETRDIPILFHSATLPSILPEDLQYLPFVEKGTGYEEIIARVRRAVVDSNQA